MTMLFFLGVLLEWLFGAWALMVIAGMVHLNVLAAVNPISYTTSLSIMFVLSLISVGKAVFAGVAEAFK